MTTRRTRTAAAQVLPVEDASPAPVSKPAPVRRGRKKAEAEAEAGEEEAAPAHGLPAEGGREAACMPEQAENRLPQQGIATKDAVRKRSAATLPLPTPVSQPAPIPSTPARAKHSSITSTPAPIAAVAAVSAIPATPAASSSRRVPCTPRAAAAAAAAIPPPLPPRPTTLAAASDPSLLRALEVVWKKVDTIAQSVVAVHGAPLDVAALYTELAAASSARHLAALCHKLGAFLHQETKFAPAAQMHTMAAQYMRAAGGGGAGGALAHLAAEMEYFALASACKQANNPAPTAASLSQPLPPLTACKDLAAKLLTICKAPSSAPPQQFTFLRTTLWVHYELAHTHLARMLLLVSSGSASGALEQLQHARVDWGCFMDALETRGLNPGCSWTPAQQVQLSEVACKLVEDLMLLAAVGTLLSRPQGDDAWAGAVRSVLAAEAARMATLTADANLRRWRYAKLVQMDCSGDSAIAAKQEQWRAQLHALPIATVSSKTVCPCMSPLSVLLSLYELAFASSRLTPFTSAQSAALHSSLREALGRVCHASSKASETDVRHAYGVYYLSLAFLGASTSHLSAPPTTIHTLYRHSYQALKQFNSMVLHADHEHPSLSSSSTSSATSAPPRQHWLFLLDFLRCMNLRAVLAESQGMHAHAASCLENAAINVDKVLYAHVPSADATAAAAPADAVPYASLLATKLLRARIHAKVDRRDLVGETLSVLGLTSDAVVTDDRVVASGMPFVGAYGVHAPQLRLWRAQVATTTDASTSSSSSSDATDADALSDEMERMSLGRDGTGAYPCTHCALYPSAPAALVPCQVDSLLTTLSSPSCAPSRRELDKLLHAHSAWRHPPLMRLLHQHLARVCMEEERQPSQAAFHMHQCMGLTARHEVNELLGASLEQKDAEAMHLNIAPYASLFSLRSTESDESSFQQRFIQGALHPSWSVCTVDVDSHGALLLSKVQQHQPSATSTMALTVAGQKLRVLLESCMLADASDADVLAAVTSIQRDARATPAATPSAPATASSLAWRIDPSPTAAPSFSSLTRDFAASISHGNEGNALAKDYNLRLKPALLLGAASASKKPSARDVKQAKEAMALIDSKRVLADSGIARCCTDMQAFLGAHLGALSGRWEEPQVEDAVASAAEAVQKMLSSKPQQLAQAVSEHARTLRTRFFPSAGDSASASASAAPPCPRRHPVILILGSSVVHLPWENIPALRSQPMSRMASWMFICASVAQQQASAASAAGALLPPVPLSPSYFVLNPQKNLSAAESRLLALLSSSSSSSSSDVSPSSSSSDAPSLGWCGSVGTPDVSQWQQALRRRAYFAYVGHNGGEEFVSPKQIRAMMKPPTPSAPASSSGAGAEQACLGVRSVALQIGCSSALQSVSKSGPRPLYDCDGLSLAYCVAACPAMLGCLWNVTDDIDRWVAHVLTALAQRKGEEGKGKGQGAEEKQEATAKRGKKSSKKSDEESTTAVANTMQPPMSLQELAIAARAACKYDHLSAASIICYGLPIAC